MLESNLIEKEIDLSIFLELNKKYSISPNQIIILLSIQKGDEKLFEYIRGSYSSEYFFKNDFDWLFVKNLVGDTSTNNRRYEFRFKDLILKENVFNEIEEENNNTVNVPFIDQWYSLWPKGIKSGGYFVRSGKAGCEKKMIKFRKVNTDFSDTLILEATAAYINRYKLQGYTYMKTAGYFISKDDTSSLAAECEALLEKPNVSELSEGLANTADDLDII